MSNQSSAQILQRMDQEIIRAEENARHWISVAETIRGLRAEVTSSRDISTRTPKITTKNGLYTDKKALLRIAKEVRLLMIVTGLTKTEACALYAERKGLGVGGPTLIGYLGKKVIGEKQAKLFENVQARREAYLQDPTSAPEDSAIGKIRSMAREWGVLS